MKKSMEHHIGIIHNRMCIIPDVIDATKDKTIWDIMFTVDFLFLDLFEDYVMDDISIKILATDYKNYLEIIDEMCKDKSKVFLINVYFILILEYIDEYCIEHELYETNANIKKFNEAI